MGIEAAESLCASVSIEFPGGRDMPQLRHCRDSNSICAVAELIEQLASVWPLPIRSPGKHKIVNVPAPMAAPASTEAAERAAVHFFPRFVPELHAP
jgi:hypothetical protein